MTYTPTPIVSNLAVPGAGRTLPSAMLSRAANTSVLTHGLALVMCTHKRPESLKRFLESLAAQDLKPDQLIIVDASPDDTTEQMLRNHPDLAQLAGCVLYFRVAGPLKGLTHQRNFGLRWVYTDLVAFFDDDVVLLPGCLHEMEQVLRLHGNTIIGAGAFMQNQSSPLARIWLWRMRRLLRLVPNLQPGRYYRSGISTPWNLPPTEALVEGDWLPGCAMMWKTTVVREVGFNGEFDGYALGEDLDFSLRARRKGKLVLAGTAHVLHLYEPTGRPSPFRWGYMAVYNKYQIHRRVFAHRTGRDIAWFTYAWTIDTLLLGRHLFFPARWGLLLRQLAGRLNAAYDICFSQRSELRPDFDQTTWADPVTWSG